MFVGIWRRRWIRQVMEKLPNNVKQLLLFLARNDFQEVQEFDIRRPITRDSQGGSQVIP